MLPYDESSLILIVKSRYKFKLCKVSIRCFNDSYTKTLPEIVEISEFKDCYDEDLVTIPDTEGGIERAYRSVNILHAGEGKYFKVTIILRQPWSGLLSFRGIDDDGFPSFGRYALGNRVESENPN